MCNPDEEKTTLSQPKGRKSSGGDICSLPFCSNGFKDGVSLHKLPADPGLQRKWLQFVSKTRCVCVLKSFCKDDYNVPLSLENEFFGLIFRRKLEKTVARYLGTIKTPNNTIKAQT